VIRYDDVPVDEGEAEAQPPVPVVTITLGDSPPEGGRWPRSLTFECPAVRGRTREIDALLTERSAEMLKREGLWPDGDPVVEWASTPEGRVRRVVYTIVGHADDTPGGEQ
jgi:hypothetical protein